MKTRLALILVCSLYSIFGNAKSDTTFFFRADLSLTNNGFSIIPAFTLGDPAAYLDMRMGNRRWSFEPQFRYSLEGRPWSFVFIYRYKAIIKPKFQLTVGGHIPGINYVTRSVSINGIDEQLSVARRFLALEIIPTYKFSDQINLGIYYLRGHGFQKHAVQNSNFLSLQGNFSRIKLRGKLYFSFSPQFFFLKVDESEGFYINATTTFGIRGFPLTVSGIVNKAVESNIAAQDFDWNVSLTYTLEQHFVRIK